MSKKVGLGLAVSGLVVAGLALPLMQISGTARADEAEKQEKTVLASPSSLTKSVDETVYVFLDANGNVKKTISSDWSKNDLGTDVYSKTEGKVSTPISMKISYSLDGKEVSAEEIRGRSGHVKIRYDFTNNERVNGMYVPIAVLSGAVLPNNTFSNIQLTNAKLINDGTRTIVAGLALPGMKENLGVNINLPEYFEIEADAKEFKMEMTATIATSKIFADLDTSALNSVDALSSALQTLSDSMLQLLNGSAQLRDGLATLNSKTGALADGVSQLRAGSLELATKAGELKTGVSDLLTGAKQLDGGVDSAIDGVNGLIDGYSQLDQGGKQLSVYIKSAIDTILKKFKESNPLLADITLEDFATKIEEAIKKMTMAGKTEEAVALKKAAEEVGGQLELYKNILAYMDKISGAAKLAESKKSALSGLKAGSTKLAGGIESLYNVVSDKLYPGILALDAGVSNLESNIPALTSGVSQLADGSKALTDGLSQFNDAGVQKLVSLYNGNVRTLVAKVQMMVNLSKNSSKAKYIYRTEEI